MAALDEHGIDPIDLVCVNLYPFERGLGAARVREEDAVEMIDVGGPSLLRAAAKNFAHVGPSAGRPVQAGARRAPRKGDLALVMRARARRRGVRHGGVRSGDRGWFADREAFPPRLISRSRRSLELAYGENPHQRASYYAEAGAGGTCSPASSSSPAASFPSTTSTT